MSTCRRQPSTFARSPLSISAVSILSLMAPPFAFLETNPFHRSWRRIGLSSAGAEALPRPRGELVEPAREVAEPRLEHRPLGVGLGDECLEAPPQLGLDVGKAPLDALDELLPLAL